MAIENKLGLVWVTSMIVSFPPMPPIVDPVVKLKRRWPNPPPVIKCSRPCNAPSIKIVPNAACANISLATSLSSNNAFFHFSINPVSTSPWMNAS